MVEKQKKIAAQYEKVISEYEKTAAETGMKIIRIDASDSIENISELIWKELNH